MVVTRKSIERSQPSAAGGWRLPGQDRIERFLTEDAWRRDRVAGKNPFWRAVRVIYLAGRGFHADDCLSRASALTYITVLSLVPLLAFAFSVAKGFGFYKELLATTINPFLDRTFGPLPEPGLTLVDEADRAPQMRLAIDKVLEFVQGTDVSALGLLGLALLLFTVIKLLGAVEKSFNEIWGVHRSRSVMRKIADYMAMVLVTPIFLFLAAGLTTAAQTKGFIDDLRGMMGLDAPIELLLSSMPVLALWGGFAFVYMAMPNTRTRLSSALVGALVAALLWQITLILHLKFQIGIARYNAIYASFAAFPIFLIWVNLSWVIVLLGSEVAFAHQSEPSYAHIDKSTLGDHAFKERTGLRAMARIARRFLRGEPAWSASELAISLGAPQRVVEEVLYACADCGLLADAYDGERRTFLPARDLEAITVKSVLDALKCADAVTATEEVVAGADDSTDGAAAPEDELIDRILVGLDREATSSRHNRTMRSLAEALEHEEAARTSSPFEPETRPGEHSPARA